MLDPLSESTAAAPPDQFDLVTFPEAFLPAADLVSTLGILEQIDSFGCVHVGLRPSKTGEHLFTTVELRELVEALKEAPRSEPTDLAAFSNWLAGQNQKSRFGIGCLFMMDAYGRLRLCLHPKLLASNIEVSPLPEKHMKEANLLTAITLRPTNKIYQSITVQPLLCSDALLFDTDRAESRPLEAIHRNAECLADNPPDHVDLVSVASCTKQGEDISSRGATYRTWHQAFKNTLLRAASDDALARHRFAAFVLANFGKIARELSAGLSGGFIPVPVPQDDHPSYVGLSTYGRPAKSTVPGRWSAPDDDISTEKWASTGYIAFLTPLAGPADAVAQMLGFTIHRFPRDVSRWVTAPGFANYTLKTGSFDAASALAFSG